MGIGNVQFLDNNGAPLTNGVLYSFQAGTSTQQSTFTDSTCTVQNVNPITMSTGGRVGIWTTTANFYKWVLCAQNDGASCAGGDILFSVDNVPGGATSGGGGGGSPFISGSANPATSGILRLASGDSICWRNTANSSNLCFIKDSNDILSWAGGSIKLPEVSAPSCAVGFDFVWADSTNHSLSTCGNGGGAVQLAYAGPGRDINNNSQIVALHFGTAQTPLSGTAPTTGQFLQWNGTNIVGYGPEYTFGWTSNLVSLAVTCTANPQEPYCAQTVFANAHTLTRFTYTIFAGPSGCSPNAVISVRDVTSSTNLTSSTVTGATGALVDSGPLSIAMTAGHTFLIGVTTAEAGCGTNPIVSAATMIYQ